MFVRMGIGANISLYAVWIVLGLLVFEARPQSINTIDPGDITKLDAALTESEKYADLLVQQIDDFGEQLHSFNQTSIPWVSGMKIFMNITYIFEPAEVDQFVAFRNRTFDIEAKLEAAKRQMIPGMDAIQWDEVYIDFNDIMEEINDVHGKLWELLYSSDRKAGLVEYIDYYHNTYLDAGRRLYDVIVENPGFYKYNVLDAAMHYNKLLRRPITNFMKGLMVLMLRAAAIELAYERCLDHDRGMDKIWIKRLLNIRQLMSPQDNILEDTWIDNFKTEVDWFAQDKAVLNDTRWANETFEYLNSKYYWRVWYVQSWTSNIVFRVSTQNADKIHARPTYYGRNLVAMTQDWTVTFNKAAAESAIYDRSCPTADSECFRDGTGVNTMFDLMSTHGTMKLVIDARIGFQGCTFVDRRVWKQALLIGKAETKNLWVIYAG